VVVDNAVSYYINGMLSAVSLKIQLFTEHATLDDVITVGCVFWWWQLASVDM